VREWVDAEPCSVSGIFWWPAPPGGWLTGSGSEVVARDARDQRPCRLPARAGYSSVYTVAEDLAGVRVITRQLSLGAPTALHTTVFDPRKMA